jgi:Asp-tRNA(Asn)/Glu-tRNA(Gln) amidotransferase A subunit family amidase
MTAQVAGSGRDMAHPRPPQDALVDRRDFMARMGALAALAALGGCAVREPGEVAAAPGPASDGAAFFRAVSRSDLPQEASTDPAELTAWEAGALIRDGDLGVEEYVEAYLERIRRWDGVYQAYGHVLEEEALAEARRQDSASPRTLLHGIPLAIKDNVYSAGIPTRANSHIFRDFVPDEDATVLARLRMAGGIPLGKSQLGPLATTRALTPDGEITTMNAWAPGDPRVSPGGSSSGSATAVMARLAASSIGTQTGGSITMPSLAQGLTGLKPTFGRTSLHGVIPLSYSRDHVGPLARDARDAALILQAMAGADPRDPRTQGLPPVPDFLNASLPVEGPNGPRVRWPTRIGVLPGWAGAPEEDGANRQAFLAEAREVGAEVVELDPPPAWEELTSIHFNTLRLVERTEPFVPYLKEDVRLFGVTLNSFLGGLFVSGDEYMKGQRAKLALLRLVMDEFLSQCDVVMLESHVPFDMIGFPLMTLPVGTRQAEGHTLPGGVLMGAGPFGEERLLAVATAIQARTDWHRRRPDDPTEAEEARMTGPNAPSRGHLDLETVTREAE